MPPPEREPHVRLAIVVRRRAVVASRPALGNLLALGGQHLLEGVRLIALAAAGDELDEEFAGPLDGLALREHSTGTVS
mgnify:CR=1 FL=1